MCIPAIFCCCANRMTAYRCDHERQIKSLLKHIIREERSIYQIRVQSKPTESPTKKNDYFFFQSWRPILHSFERKTFNVPSLITKVSNNCQRHAILSFIKRKPSITTHDAVQELHLRFCLWMFSLYTRHLRIDI